ncbi:MAG: dipeptidase [Proteobacteria bacterium]|jgi:dipeptidase|nr:dipeptidase [Pseudomonadota bacterium]
MNSSGRMGMMVVFGLFSNTALACTNFLVTKGASVDGSTMITYAADSHVLYGEMTFQPARHFPEGAKVDVFEWDTGKFLKQIDQVTHTYSVVGNMNERQVAIGETTWGGRHELHDSEGGVDYGSMIYLALERAGTAREAIEVMTGLATEYGYYSSGETFSIADPDEAWIMDLIGKGPGNKGAVWVARRIPDGYISAHANSARIETFPLKDKKKETLYAPDVITFAREQGYFDGPDEDFSFADAYDPDNYGGRRFCDARVWCMFDRAAPELELTPDFVKGKVDAESVPLWIQPEEKVSLNDLMAYMRDHFEGTDLDMTADIGAGPYNLPYRWRPLTWHIGEKEYFNERATATQQTGFSFVSQSRSWLPDVVGGVLWFGVDDAASSVYFPMYSSSTEVPISYAVGTGSFEEVTFDAAFWVFNDLSNYVYSRYQDMIVDVQKVQGDVEAGFFAEQAEIDAAALGLFEQSPRRAKDYLTEYSCNAGNSVVDRWRELRKSLLYKYLDGNVKDEFGNVTHPGYPESWYQKVADATGEHLAMIEMPAEKKLKEEDQKKAREFAGSILALLKARGLSVDDKQKATILESDDMSQLKEWLVAAASAKKIDEVLSE